MRGKRREQNDFDVGSLFPAAFGSDHDDGSARSGSRSWITEYIVPFGTLLIAALALLAQHVSLPTVVWPAVILYLLVAAGAALYGPLVRAFRWFAVQCTEARLARSSRPRLLETLRHLGRLLARDQADTVLYVVREVAQWDELRGVAQLDDPEHIETLRTWASSISGRLSNYKRRDFSAFCHELSALINQYNRFCCQRQQIFQGVIAAGKVPEPRLRQLKQRWNVHREGHVEFVTKWTDLARSINLRVERRVCIEYYEPLGTLE